MTFAPPQVHITTWGDTLLLVGCWTFAQLAIGFGGAALKDWRASRSRRGMFAEAIRAAMGRMPSRKSGEEVAAKTGATKGDWADPSKRTWIDPEKDRQAQKVARDLGLDYRPGEIIARCPPGGLTFIRMHSHWPKNMGLGLAPPARKPIRIGQPVWGAAAAERYARPTFIRVVAKVGGSPVDWHLEGRGKLGSWFKIPPGAHPTSTSSADGAALRVTFTIGGER